MTEREGAPGVEGLGARSITEYDGAALARAGVRGVGGVQGMNARVRALGDVLIIEAWGASSEVERRPLRPGLPTIDIIFVEEGEFEYLDGSAWRASRGPLMIAPSGLPSRVRFTSEWRFIVARIPRDALLQFVPMFADAVGIYTDLTMPEQAMHAFLALAVRSEHPVSEAESHTLDRQVLDMAGTLVLERTGLMLPFDTPRAVLRKRALAEIAKHSGDPSLTPQALAASVNVSLRRLQDVFTEAGSTIAAEIRRERARVARSMLQDPRFDDTSAADIAARVGFGSAASMRRTFADLYRIAPAELRNHR